MNPPVPREGVRLRIISIPTYTRAPWRTNQVFYVTRKNLLFVSRCLSWFGAGCADVDDLFEDIEPEGCALHGSQCADREADQLCGNPPAFGRSRPPLTNPIPRTSQHVPGCVSGEHRAS